MTLRDLHRINIAFLNEDGRVVHRDTVDSAWGYKIDVPIYLDVKEVGSERAEIIFFNGEKRSGVFINLDALILW